MDSPKPDSIYVGLISAAEYSPPTGVWQSQDTKESLLSIFSYQIEP